MNYSVYLDYNATAPVRPEVVSRMQELLAQPLNPSSVHRYGREAKKHLENARKTVADAISAWPNEIIFTASGTEANATALRGFPGRRMVVSAVEHSSVLRVASDEWRVTSKKESSLLTTHHSPLATVTPSGLIDVSALDAVLASDDTPALVSVMLANNETGVIQPIAEVGAICKKYGALLHCDAVQALGKIPVDFGALNCDMMTISAHKCGGPVGAAALVVRRDLAFQPLLAGGRQELGRRAGTENVAATAGFAAAAERFDFDHMRRLRSWLDAAERQMSDARYQMLNKNSSDIRHLASVFGALAPRLLNTSCIAMPGVSNEVQLMDFDLKGFAVSAGSACSSGRIEPSHVLMAMGVPKELAACAIRVSGGWATTEQDIRFFTEAWLQMHARLGRKAS